MTKSRIAIVISLMFAAPAAVVALEQSASADVAQAPQEIQAAAPEAALEPAAPVEVVVAEPVVITETTIVAEVPAAEPIPQAAPKAQRKGIMGWLQARAATDAFPKADGPDDVERNMLPAQMAYFNRIDQDRSQRIARGDVFPSGGSVEDKEPLPAVVAYYDRAEQQRLASTQPRQPVVARVESDRRSSEEIAQAGSAELSLADSSAIR